MLITGAARRIGAVLARAFAGAGWHVVVHVHRLSDEARAFTASLPSAELVACDLLDGDAALAMVEQLAGKFDDWRMLVNCAAVFVPDSAEAIDPAVFAEAITVNAETPTRMAQAYLARARSPEGRRVIQFLDQKLRNPNPDFFSYTMAKHAFPRASGCWPWPMPAALTGSMAWRPGRCSPASISSPKSMK